MLLVVPITSVTIIQKSTITYFVSSNNKILVHSLKYIALPDFLCVTSPKLRSDYGATVVLCHSCIQSLDVLELVWSIDIKLLDVIVTRYYNCTTNFPPKLRMCARAVR